MSDDSCQDMCWLFDRLYWFLQRGNPHISPRLWHTKLARLDLWGCAWIIVQGHFSRVVHRGTEVENFRTSPHIHYHLLLALTSPNLCRSRSCKEMIIIHSEHDCLCRCFSATLGRVLFLINMFQSSVSAIAWIELLRVKEMKKQAVQYMRVHRVSIFNLRCIH